VKSCDRGPFRITIAYRPAKYFLTEKMKIEGNESHECADRNPPYESAVYFAVNIRPLNKNGYTASNGNFGLPAGSTERPQDLRELLFGLRDDLYIMLPNGQKVFPEVYQLDRDFGKNKGCTNLLFAFDKQVVGERKNIALSIGTFGPFDINRTFEFDL